MEKIFNKFMSLIDIDSFNVIRDSEIGNTITYHDILQIFIISHNENITVSRLADILNLSRAATTQKVNFLVEKGLVKKITSAEDKRQVYLKLTKKATNGMNEAKSVKVLDMINKEFSKGEIKVFERILEFMCMKLEENNSDK